MEEFIEYLAKNPILNFSITIGSIILGLYGYFKNKREKIPIFGIKTTRLIQETITSLKRLEINYESRVVKTLSLTEFSFWNQGKQTILKEDIPVNDPFVIKASDEVVIYDFEIMEAKPANNFKVEKLNDNTLSLSFDFIDKNQGIVLNIYHSGVHTDDIKVKGSFIGAPVIKKYQEDPILDVVMYFPPLKWSENLVNSKIKILSLLGFGLGIMLFILLMPLFFVLGPINYLYKRINNLRQGSFLLFDKFEF